MDLTAAAALPAARLERVCVRYRVPREPVSGLKEFAVRWAHRRLAHVDFWALRDVDLEIGRGEIFGVVGRNGAGKTTLLRVLARVLHPTSGRVQVFGRAAPLLELGGGFHPELTGRENVYLYASLLGLERRDTQRRFSSMVEFAELADFIDSPLRIYSTGMIARLGFAVATSRPSEVLLIDEALTVGDERFQHKCLARMDEYRRLGCTIVFVTHALSTARQICDRAAWLEAGTVRRVGPATEVIDAYARWQPTTTEEKA
ncbi:MAG TPA: ABC transporter ATP-binding protein [Anaerolineales bacterium]|nr:ABC transporter ATP-binding protein [Anaerolineales bacterium]